VAHRRVVESHRQDRFAVGVGILQFATNIAKGRRRLADHDQNARTGVQALLEPRIPLDAARDPAIVPEAKTEFIDELRDGGDLVEVAPRVAQEEKRRVAVVRLDCR
jgi:hypothetical protein